MNDNHLQYLNIIALAIAVSISAYAIITEQQRFFVGLAVAGIVASFALKIFTIFLSGIIVKICASVLVFMFAAKVFKKIAKG